MKNITLYPLQWIFYAPTNFQIDIRCGWLIASTGGYEAVPQQAARFHSSCAFGIDRQDETLKIAHACMRYL
jgi:hypothetical protein